MPERLKRQDPGAPASQQVKVGMVDDHPAFRLGLARLLERDGQFDVVWSAGSVAQALRSLERMPVDLLLMDLQFAHGVDGFGGLKIVRERWPNTRVLVVTAFADTQAAAAARGAGAAGIVSKDVTLDELYLTIKQAASRGKVRSLNGTGKAPAGDAAIATSDRLAKLTKRELEVLADIRRGMTNREIALRLGVSTTTVNKHVHGVLAKLGARNRAQAANVR